MSSHFSTLGFPVSNQEGFAALVQMVAKVGTGVECERGWYIRWAAGEGIELWAQGDNQQQLIGCNPHFSGSSRVRAAVTAVLPDSRAAMDGSLYCWANPPPGEVDTGEYPFVVDLPDFYLKAHQLKCPSIVNLQVAAFAQQLECFDSDEAFQTRMAEARMAPESFIPTGLFKPDGAQINPPQARAYFAGHVQEFQHRKNPWTTEPFVWLSVKTLGGTFDVVAHPTAVKGQPHPGGVASGTFWLTARLAE